MSLLLVFNFFKRHKLLLFGPLPPPLLKTFYGFKQKCLCSSHVVSRWCWKIEISFTEKQGSHSFKFHSHISCFSFSPIEITHKMHNICYIYIYTWKKRQTQLRISCKYPIDFFSPQLHVSSWLVCFNLFCTIKLLNFLIAFKRYSQKTRTFLCAHYPECPYKSLLTSL